MKFHATNGRSTPSMVKDGGVAQAFRTGDALWYYDAGSDTWYQRDSYNCVIRASVQSWDSLLHGYGPVTLSMI